MSLARFLTGLAGLALLGPACNYQSGLSLPEGCESVAITIFKNDSKLRDLEAQLNAEIGLAVERLVDVRLTTPAQADYVVRGRILEYVRRGGIRTVDNELLETGLTIAVSAELARGRTDPLESPIDIMEPARDIPLDPVPAGVVARTRVSAQSGYRLDEVSGEERARQRALRNLADRIVLDLFSPLAYESQP